MLRFNYIFASAFLVSSLFLFSCKKGSTPEHTRLIPKEAGVVFKVDLKSLTSKTISLQELLSEESFKGMGQEEEKAKHSSKVLKKFLDSGIDLLNNVYLFASNLESSSPKGGLTFAIDNEDKFLKFLQDEAFWKEVREPKPTINAKEKIKIATFENGTKIAWKNKVGLFAGGEKYKPTDDEVKKLFEMSESESLVSNSSFQEAINKSFDVAIWLDADKVSKASTQGNMQATMIVNILADTKDSYFTIGTNFEKGKIVTTIDYAGNEYMQKVNDQIARNTISADLLKNIPFAEPSTGFSIALNLEGVWKFFRDKGIVGEIDRELKDINLNGDLLIRTFTGEILGVSERVDFEAESPKMGKLPVDFVIAFVVKDKASFEELMNKINKQMQGILQKNDNNYEIIGTEGGIILKDKIAYLTMTKSFLTALKKGGGELKGEFADKATSAAAAIYFGKPFFDAIAASLQYKQSEFGQVYKKFPIEGIIVTSDKVKNKKNQTLITVNMSDKSKNALVVIMDILKKSEEIRKKQMEQWEKEFKTEEEMPETIRPQDEPVLEDK